VRNTMNTSAAYRYCEMRMRAVAPVNRGSPAQPRRRRGRAISQSADRLWRPDLAAQEWRAS
jgi:hypothetical protein